MLFGIAADAAAAKGEAAVEIKGIWRQGELIIGQVAAGSQVAFKGKPIRVGDDGHFVIGLDRDEEGEPRLEVRTADGRTHAESHRIAPRTYSIQKLTLPPDKVNPPPEVTARIERETQLARKARMIDSPRDDYETAFAWPATGRISGVYGSQRILNGEKKQPHYGVDVAVPTGTPVRAPAGGIVTLAEPDLYYTGGTLMIDHGHGLTSAFLHLSQLQAKVGDAVKQGDVIALSGASGRATGPHLDWRISWLDARVDPQRLVPPMVADPSDKSNKNPR
ncbi:M23 family metallopeptidase [Hydrocarboniphaga sp.]|uniref:M23 family metallopeptidase n=1 Tax=Hydrocarboniphaga sp. TaxID=2033016 RepID=UPI0026294A08|nr:M23 family metallopeptidase [Hydrocarboniphaga sp.]